MINYSRIGRVPAKLKGTSSRQAMGFTLGATYVAICLAIIERVMRV